MKLNLLLGEPESIRPGYTNIDPMAPPGQAGVISASIFDLSHTVDANECDEVIALRIIEYLPRDRVKTVLAHWATCLAHAGTLTVSTTDLAEVARSLADGRISPEVAEGELYGVQAANWDYVKSGQTMRSLVNLLAGLGLEVVQKHWVGHRAVVTARRP